MNHKQGAILIVEDDPGDEALLLHALRRSSVSWREFLVCRDGQEALEYLFGTGPWSGRDTSVLPQVILLDLRLPKVDGLEVLQRIREDERTARIPVLIFTSSKEDQDRCRGLGLGANSFASKPATLDGYVHIFRQLRRLGLQRLMDDEPIIRAGRPA
jgi:two-component system, response regulator